MNINGCRLLWIACMMLGMLSFSGCTESDSDDASDDESIVDGDSETANEDDIEQDVTETSDGDEDFESEEGHEDEPVAPILFRLPLQDSEGNYSSEYVFGVDHDPEVHSGIGAALCTNYAGEGFPWCYDEHMGSDYILAGGFESMDQEVAYVYAAADGTVTETRDGYYDRCHSDIENPDYGNISCDGNEVRANYIAIEHAGGIVTLYYHLKKDSLLVDIGDDVNCGDPLALVGSSGISAGPHLHFQVEDAAGAIIDPYRGEYSQEYSYWVEQVSENGLPSENCPE